MKTGGRKDSNLAGVILSEKRDKKLVKYQADKVPYPFTSREQYERSLRTTVGPEWNTLSTFSELTKPDVSVSSCGAACSDLCSILVSVV